MPKFFISKCFTYRHHHQPKNLLIILGLFYNIYILNENIKSEVCFLYFLTSDDRQPMFEANADMTMKMMINNNFEVHWE